MAKQENIIKNRQWLADKSHEEGVTAVGAGVFAKVLKKGPALARFDKRLDCSTYANAPWRPLENLYSGRARLWNAFTSGHTRRINSGI